MIDTQFVNGEGVQTPFWDLMPSSGFSIGNCQWEVRHLLTCPTAACKVTTLDDATRPKWLVNLSKIGYSHRYEMTSTYEPERLLKHCNIQML